MATNDCENGALNTGQPNCVPRKSVDTGIIFVNYLADDGTVNSIKPADTFDTAYVTALINNADKSKRWYPLMDLKTVVGERADNVTQDIDGIAFNVKRGVRSYDGMVYGNNANPGLVKALESRSAIRDAYYKIDINGNLTGIYDSVTGEIRPIKIQSSTLKVKYIEPKASELQAVSIKFDVDETQKDADLRTLNSSTISADLLDIRGLIDVNGTSSAPSTTGFVLTANFNYGDAFVPTVFSGAVLADFVVYNSTTASSVTVSSVTETPDGVYTFVIPAQTSLDVLTVNLSKSGFEMAEVTVSIP